MTIINTVSEKYFSLNGINFAKIYQPLKQGSENIGIYNVKDSRHQILQSTRFNEIQIDGVTYGSQAETIAQLLNVIFVERLSSEATILIEGKTDKGGYTGTTQDLKNELDARAFEGLITYQGLAALQAVDPIPVDGTPAKVVNDSTASNNGTYSVVAGAWVQDSIQLAGEVEASNNTEGVVGSKIHEAIESKGNEIIDSLSYDPLEETVENNAFKDTFGGEDVNSVHVASNKSTGNQISNVLTRIKDSSISSLGAGASNSFKNVLTLSANPSDVYTPVLNYKITPEQLASIGVDVLSPSYSDVSPKQISIRMACRNNLAGNGITGFQFFVSILYNRDPLTYTSYELNQNNAVISSSSNFYGTIKNENTSKDFDADTVVNFNESNYKAKILRDINIYKEVQNSGVTKTFGGILISVLPISVDANVLQREIQSFGLAVVNSEDFPNLDIDTDVRNSPSEKFFGIPTKLSEATDVDASGIQDGQVLSWNETQGKYTPQDITEEVNLLTVKNSEKIAFYGCSFTESYYAVKNKSWVNKLAQMTDYIVANFGVSGNRLVDESQRLLDNSNPYHGTIGIKELNPTYVSFANIGNETLHSAGSNNLDLYKSSMIEAIQAVRQLGAIPIMGTDHYIQNDAIDSMLYQLAEEYQTLYWGIGAIGAKIVNNGIPAFWGGSHPATRTNAHQFIEWLYFISKLPRPKKSIKIFRVRQSYKVGSPTISDLNYDNIVQRVKFWQEINSGEKALKEANGQNGWEYYDRLNENFSGETITNEYCKLINNENVEFNKKALFEFIIDKVKPSSVKLYFKTITQGLDFYIKDNNNSGDYKDNSRAQAAFKVTKAVYDSFNEAVDTLFTSAAHGSNQMQYKGKYKSEALGGYWLFFKLLAGSATAGNAGNLTKVSGGTTYAYELSDYNIGRHSFDFLSTVELPQMRFVSVASTYENGYAVINLNDIDTRFIDFDKIKIIASDAGTFNISDVFAEIQGGIDKPSIQKDFIPKLNGTELNTVTSFGADWISSNNWMNEGASLDQMPSGLRDYPTVNSSLNHITLGWDAEMFPNKIKKVFSYPEARAYTKATVKVVARLFPKIFNTTVPEDDYYTSIRQITPDSYDMGALCLGLKIGSVDIPSVMRKNVDIGWSEITFETYLPPFNDDFELSLWRDEKDLIDSNYKNQTFPLQVYDVSVQID